MTREVELIRALAEDLAVEIMASYTADDFRDADFTSLGLAAVYLEEHGSEPGPVLVELIAKVQSFAGTPAESSAPEPPPLVGEP
jgi:hypothetical protein